MRRTNEAVGGGARRGRGTPAARSDGDVLFDGEGKKRSVVKSDSPVVKQGRGGPRDLPPPPLFLPVALQEWHGEGAARRRCSRGGAAAGQPSGGAAAKQPGRRRRVSSSGGGSKQRQRVGVEPSAAAARASKGAGSGYPTQGSRRPLLPCKPERRLLLVRGVRRRRLLLLRPSFLFLQRVCQAVAGNVELDQRLKQGSVHDLALLSHSVASWQQGSIRSGGLI
ncbi:hypothetical protein Taro_046881 [Colocasia esculenta]|uniref:Uncharacterized protein n=1 Tax=Colocasia esculenta TaxID=4460 RepID=A0A843X632_COLES|nr:hypothetical protein [Colocasia esculenta]